MKDRIMAATLALVLPVLALAQPIDSRASNPQPIAGDVGGGRWLFILVLIAAIAIAFWGFRTMRQRRGPHGPQEPTPRGP
jgi:hypothetical protein